MAAAVKEDVDWALKEGAKNLVPTSTAPPLRLIRKDPVTGSRGINLGIVLEIAGGFNRVEPSSISGRILAGP
jgi:hypothetical protein